MTSSTHAHEVLHLIVDAEGPLSVDRLRGMVEERFGADCRFHTCSAQDMQLDELLQFLAGRQKIAVVDGEVKADPARICDHD